MHMLKDKPLSIFWEMELQHCRIHSFVICLNGCAINECTLEENCISREERAYNIQQSALHQPPSSSPVMPYWCLSPVQRALYWHLLYTYRRRIATNQARWCDNNRHLGSAASPLPALRCRKKRELQINEYTKKGRLLASFHLARNKRCLKKRFQKNRKEKWFSRTQQRVLGVSAKKKQEEKFDEGKMMVWRIGVDFRQMLAVVS